MSTKTPPPKKDVAPAPEPLDSDEALFRRTLKIHWGMLIVGCIILSLGKIVLEWAFVPIAVLSLGAIMQLTLVVSKLENRLEDEGVDPHRNRACLTLYMTGAAQTLLLGLLTIRYIFALFQ